MMGGALGGALGSICPPGFYCMDTGTVLLSALVVVSIAAVVIFALKYNGLLTVDNKPTVVVVESRVKESGPTVPMVAQNVDARFAPLSPEKSYGLPPDLRGYPTAPIAAGVGALPVNIATRGIPDTYQQLGVLTTPGGTDNSGTPTRTILPLFGRSTDSARNRWNYYTRTDGMNPVQVPVQFKRRNCDDDTGCDEVTSGDSVGVPIMGQSFVANIYRYSTPRYLPIV